MARPRKYTEPRICVSARLPESLVNEVRDHLRDPFTDKVAYGALGDLIHNLLREWLAELNERKGETQ